MTKGVYKKLSGPKRRVWPKFPQTLGSLTIPTSTYAAELSDHIVSLKLGFVRKRQHDPKGFLDAHLRQNHFKAGYTHEEKPDDSIYLGVDTFSEVLYKAKSKEEQSQILLYHKEIRHRIQNYRTMELDIQEKLRKDREEKEALAIKESSVASTSDRDKGKVPMEILPRETVAQ